MPFGLLWQERERLRARQRNGIRFCPLCDLEEPLLLLHPLKLREALRLQTGTALHSFIQQAKRFIVSLESRIHPGKADQRLRIIGRKLESLATCRRPRLQIAFEPRGAGLKHVVHQLLGRPVSFAACTCAAAIDQMP